MWVSIINKQVPPELCTVGQEKEGKDKEFFDNMETDCDFHQVGPSRHKLSV